MEGEQYQIPGQHIYKGKLYYIGAPKESLEKIEQYVFDDTDVILVSYPKSGTHWVASILWMIEHAESKESLSSLPHQKHWEYVPYLEHAGHSRDALSTGACIDQVMATPPPRIMHTHLTPDFYHKTLETRKTKFIIVMRNVKDVLTSYYHFYKVLPPFGPFKGSWEDFFEMFKQKCINFGDYFDFNIDWFQHTNKPNVMYIKYEDMIEHPTKSIAEIAGFLGKELSQKRLDLIVQETSFSVMKSKRRPEDGKDVLFRKGKIGNWKELFTVNQSKEVDAMIKDRLTNKGLEFTYE